MHDPSGNGGCEQAGRRAGKGDEKLRRPVRQRAGHADRRPKGVNVQLRQLLLHTSCGKDVAAFMRDDRQDGESISLPDHRIAAGSSKSSKKEYGQARQKANRIIWS